MSKPFPGYMWLILFLCILLDLGLSGCSSHKTNSVSRLTLLVAPSTFSRSNIGLVGAPAGKSEALTLPSHLSLKTDKGIVTQAFQGMWYGAVAGFHVGQEFCGFWGYGGKVDINIDSADPTLGLTLLVLCGGGIVGGVGIGAAFGMVAPFVSSPHPTEIIVARERIIRGVWGKLITHSVNRTDSHERDASAQFMDANLDVSGVGFGEKYQPFSALMRIEPIQVGLFSKSKFKPRAFSLLWNIRVIYFDNRQRIVAKQIIEIEQGEYGFNEWAEQEASLLKDKLEQGYQLAANQIIGKLSMK